MKPLIQNKFFLILVAASFLLPTGVQAKKKKDKEAEPQKQSSAVLTENAASSPATVQARINALSEEEKRLFDSLSKEQKEVILKGKVDIGFNEWMIKLAVGEPYYGTEHHPVFVDYEQVWLFTKPERTEERKEVMDPNSSWPTLHRTIKIKSCTVGDYFLLFDRGVVEKIIPETTRKVYGSCTIETSEAFLPIVNGRVSDPKPVEPK